MNAADLRSAAAAALPSDMIASDRSLAKRTIATLVRALFKAQGDVLDGKLRTSSEIREAFSRVDDRIHRAGCRGLAWDAVSVLDDARRAMWKREESWRSERVQLRAELAGAEPVVYASPAHAQYAAEFRLMAARR